MTEQKTAKVGHQPAQGLPQPLKAAASVLGKVPGAAMVGRVAEGTLDKIGAVSPRGRRLAVYTGAGVLGVAGVVEWPVALTGAAVAWLTQPKGDQDRPQGRPDGEPGVDDSGAGPETGAGDRNSEGSEGSEGSENAGGSPRASAGDTSHHVPTPQVMAEAAHGGVVPGTPSGKLPTRHSEPPGSGGPQGSTTHRADTNDH